MTDRLQPIIAQKMHEVAQLKDFIQTHPAHAITQILQGDQGRERNQSFQQVLQAPGLSVIAEIKRKSPSRGDLANIADPVELAQAYIAGGAAAISILTDECFFNGYLQDLQAVATACKQSPTPLLRKDFIIDECQIAEAVYAGADAILAIVAVLGSRTKSILRTAKSMNIDVLVEVHTLAELNLAIDSGAQMIGINNRDLTTFAVNCDHSFALIEQIPDSIICVAESGIRTPDLARNYHQVGFDAVLIGEALVTADSVQQFIGDCQHA